MREEEKTPYEDIINLPHWDPKYHKRMSNSDRAAQFAPFAALTGFSEALEKAEKEHLRKFEAEK
jgi:hypothetical protein